MAVRQLTWTARAVLILLAGALLVTATVVAVGPRLWGIANAHEELPIELPEFAPLSQRTLAYDAVGGVIAVYERENSQPITLDKVPADVVAAILSIEDKEFFVHKGVNVRSLSRAMLSNFSTDSARQGASTITQQVVKNEFLAGLPRDGRYKILQAVYALRLEKVLTKDEILERYLNTVYFGNNAYGLAAGAEVYFGKEVSELTLVEGAFLGGMVRSPSGDDPIRNPYESRRRFGQVVDRLADVGLLSRLESERLAEQWELPEVTQRPPGVNTTPTYFTAALTEYLLERSNLLGETEQERANLLFRGGLRIRTTLDPTLQSAAETARNRLPNTGFGFDAAIVSLDTATGAVRAMVGGREYDPINRSVNMALVPRQTGSSIKLFILAAALQAGAQPGDVIDGARPCTLPDPGNPKGPPFVIEEGAAGFVGTLEQHTAKSINCAFGRLSQIVGLHRVVDTTYRMAGSSYLYRGQPESEREPIQPYASYATGANEMAPIDMAAGIQTIANQGLHKAPYYVERIDRADGTNLFVQFDPGVQVLDAGVALTAVKIMKGVLRNGTAANALGNLPFPATGKTGTQEDNTNSWFVGATPYLSTAVWVGDPNGYTPMVNIPEFLADSPRVAKVQGGTYPARIWRAFMEPIHGALPPLDWVAAPSPSRTSMRLYLPGNECLAKLVSGTLPLPPGVTTVPPETTPPVTGPDGSTIPPPVTTVPRAVVVEIPSDTTIPPDNLDSRSPLPMTELTTFVFNCAKPPPSVIIRDD